MQAKQSLFKAIQCAGNGVLWFLITERNAKVQLYVMLIVISCGFIFHLAPIEWCIVLLCNALVLGLEILNTAIEQVCDLYCKDYNEQIKFIKDASAGAVLIVSIASVIIGTLIFLPKIFNLINTI